jgi:myo-inositol-1(or 4)-monophosphatase
VVLKETRAVNAVSELVDIAKTVAMDAAEFIRLKRLDRVDVANTKSSSSDVVTDVDKASERLIFERLQQRRPHDGFLGEEGGSDQSQSGVTWVVDPIDGTTNFIYNIPHYAVSIAAVEGPPTPEEWTLLAGCVVNPTTGDVFTAGSGLGAYRGEKRLTVRQPVDLHDALVLTGFAYGAHFRRHQAALLVDVLPRVRDIRRAGTASLDLAMIAEGLGDVYMERTISPWDFAAAAVLVQEAGGVVTGFHGRAPGREGVFAGHPEMVARLHDLVVEFGGDIPLADIPPLASHPG